MAICKPKGTKKVLIHPNSRYTGQIVVTMPNIIELTPGGLEPFTSAFREMDRRFQFEDPWKAVLELRDRFPVRSGTASDLAYTLKTLHADGTLFSGSRIKNHRRLFKNNAPDTNDCWAEVVYMTGRASEEAYHVHDFGEVWLGLSLGGDPRFDGFPPGWGYFPKDHAHVPEVKGGEMLIFYAWIGGPASFPNLKPR